MADLQAARRYAQAAFELARESGDLDRWRADLGDIAEVLAESGAASVLADGRLPLESRYAMVDRVLDVQPLAINMAKLLISKGRSYDARAVSDAFNRFADEHQGIEHAQITTAVELTPAQVEAIEQRLSGQLGKRVTATAVVNPAIIGGAVLRVGDRIVDGSVRTRLRQLRRQLEGAF